jgi:hypothetical protein
VLQLANALAADPYSNQVSGGCHALGQSSHLVCLSVSGCLRLLLYLSPVLFITLFLSRYVVCVCCLVAVLDSWECARNAAIVFANVCGERRWQCFLGFGSSYYSSIMGGASSSTVTVGAANIAVASTAFATVICFACIYVYMECLLVYMCVMNVTALTILIFYILYFLKLT